MADFQSVKIKDESDALISENNPFNVSLGFSSTTELGEVAVSERTPLIELNSAYGISELRDITTITGSATITTSAGEIVLTSSAVASSSAQIKSSEVGRYIPGYAAQIGVGIRRPTAPTGNQELRWGGKTPDGQNGLLFGEDSTGVYVSRLTGGSLAGQVYKGSWSVDNLDGNGPSGITLDMTEGNIFQIDFTWYGYGRIVWGIIYTIENLQTFIPVHIEKVDGAPSIQSPNMQIFSSVDNGGDASSIVSYLGGRQYSVMGKYVPHYRFVGEYRASTNTSTTNIPLITFRGKTGFLDRVLVLDAIVTIISAQDVVISIIIAGTLTGASFANPTGYTASETATEVDISATAISGGVMVWNSLEQAGATLNRPQLTDKLLELPLSAEKNISLCVRTLTGAGTISSFFRLKEEW